MYEFWNVLELRNTNALNIIYVFESACVSVLAVLDRSQFAPSMINMKSSFRSIYKNHPVLFGNNLKLDSFCAKFSSLRLLLSNVKSWVKGVANIRGRLLPIFDMGEFFGGRLKNNKKVQRILALDTDNVYSGLWVDHVHGMQHFPIDSKLEHLPGGLPHSISAYISGGFQPGESPWFVFNPVALVEDPVFLNVALG